MAAPTTKMDLAALRSQAEAHVKAADERSNSAPAKADKLIPREITIKILYPKPGSGEILSANLTSRILTGDERRIASRTEVMLAGGIAVHHMSVLDQNRIRALAVCSVQLRDPDAWVLEHIEEDDNLLFNIYGALEDHTNRYYFRDGGPSEDDSPARRLVVVTPFGAKAEAQ